MPRLKIIDWREEATSCYMEVNRDRPRHLAVDTETTGIIWTDRPFCMSVAWRDDEGTLKSGYFDLALSLEHARATLFCCDQWIFHNAKFDMQKLILAGVLNRDDIKSTSFHDTLCLAQLLDTNQPLKRLKYLAKVVLGMVTREAEVMVKVRRKLKLKKEDGFERIPRHLTYRYAKKDAEFTLMLFEHYAPLMDPEMYPLYERERKLTLCLLDIEAQGMRADITYTKATLKLLNLEIEKLGARLCTMVGKPLHHEGVKVKDKDLYFNPNSPVQLLAVLRDRGIEVTATNKEALEGIDDFFIQTLTEFREKSKLVSTYLMPILKEQQDGIIHPHFNEHGAVTGRMSSSAANDG